MSGVNPLNILNINFTCGNCISCRRMPGSSSIPRHCLNPPSYMTRSQWKKHLARIDQELDEIRVEEHEHPKTVTPNTENLNNEDDNDEDDEKNWVTIKELLNYIMYNNRCAK